MDIQKNWEKALAQTEIIRSRIKNLMTFEDTQVPYIILSASSVNLGDTVVRQGSVRVTKPTIILPPNIPQFLGFESEESSKGDLNEPMVMNFLMVRGVSMPSLKYNNQTYSVDVHEDSFENTIAYYKDYLQRREDVQTGLIACPDECWQFSLLLYLGMQTAKNTESDIRYLFERHHKENPS